MIKQALDAMEIVRKIREHKYTGVCAHCGEAQGIHRVYGDDGNLYCRGSHITQYEPGYTTLTDTEAAALIADYGRRVPRAFVEEILDEAWNCLTDRLEGNVLQKIATKHDVKLEPPVGKEGEE